MAFAPLLRQQLLPLAAAGMGATYVLYPRVSHAEEPVVDPVREIRKRKPIYESSSALALPSVREISSTTPAPASGSVEVAPRSQPQQPKTLLDEVSTRRQGPTERLAAQVKNARLLFHSYAVRAEDAVNRGMDRFMSAEKNFTSTVASLAPSRETNEKLLPGGIYVLIAAMAGSIISRNRNILIRFVTPIATGVTTAHYVVPNTTHNVGNLIWRYEEKYPVIRDNHLRVSQGIRHFIETGKAHSQMGVAMAEEKVAGVRETVAEWVQKGR